MPMKTIPAAINGVSANPHLIEDKIVFGRLQKAPEIRTHVDAEGVTEKWVALTVKGEEFLAVLDRHVTLAEDLEAGDTVYINGKTLGFPIEVAPNDIHITFLSVCDLRVASDAEGTARAARVLMRAC
jgi:hypothetical protein